MMQKRKNLQWWFFEKQQIIVIYVKQDHTHFICSDFYHDFF